MESPSPVDDIKTSPQPPLPAEDSSTMDSTVAGELKISANERRRLRKLQEKEEKAAKKKDAAAPAVDENVAEKAVAVDEESFTPAEYMKFRIAQVEDFWASHNLPRYPHKFEVTLSVADIVAKYQNLEEGEHRENDIVSCAGRLLRVAGSGSNLRFYDLVCNDSKIQIMANASHHTDEHLNFADAHQVLRRGDFVGVTGFIGKSKRGELSIFPSRTILLSPCLHMLPKATTGLKDQEVRYRQRYLDMMINPQVKNTFKIRSQIVNHVKSYLTDRDFIEVETPQLNMVAGGANARPFVTHHNDLNMELFMRIAPELYLKMLVVGGMDRVFEMGKNFRNEGIDLTHNPEFTGCEFYMAYADFNDVQRMTEEMVAGMVQKIHGKTKLMLHPDGPDGEAVEVDFTPPYPRLSFVEEIEKRSNKTLPRPLDGTECIEFMKKMCVDAGLDVPRPPTASKLLDKLCGHYVEGLCRNPTFIADHPQIMSPLAKWHRSRSEMTERCELFILGKEVANFYTEMNDPIAQRRTFEDQTKDKAAGDDEACPIDETFCTSLEYGLPPTGGWGMGIDRMTMFMTDNFNIKEVILFPAMKPIISTPANPATNQI